MYHRTMAALRWPVWFMMARSLAADTYVLSAHEFRQESVLVDYAIASLLPVLGFWLPWEVIRFLDWISSGLSGQPTARRLPTQRSP
jgi:hypothetical protein